MKCFNFVCEITAASTEILLASSKKVTATTYHRPKTLTTSRLVVDRKNFENFLHVEGSTYLRTKIKRCTAEKKIG
jgi:hypothetical protein